MTFSQWLDKLASYASPTDRGARLDLRLYVYPDGHGNIQYLHDDGRGGDQQPVGRPGEAIDVLRHLWERAAHAREDRDAQATGEPRGPRMAAALSRLAEGKALASIPDPVAWQREQRADRDLPGRDS